MVAQASANLHGFLTRKQFRLTNFSAIRHRTGAVTPKYLGQTWQQVFPAVGVNPARSAHTRQGLQGLLISLDRKSHALAAARVIDN